MKELVVLSGKGGTGKTSVTAALAALGAGAVLADCDVDAANFHLVLGTHGEAAHPFVSGHTAVIRTGDCSGCGECARLCRFDAILTETVAGGIRFRVDPIACEGCGVCVHFCPGGAIDFPSRTCGWWGTSRTRFGTLIHAALDVGAENSGKLVTLVREQARKAAIGSGADLVLVDGPPGIGCPVTASLTGVDLALLVTEPSLPALHDLGRIRELARHFAVPVMVCINKWDLNPRLSDRIAEFCRDQGIPVVGRLPYDPLAGDAQIAGLSLVEFAPESPAARALAAMWEDISGALAAASQPKG
ncbi:MAG: 4Fe-4S binding protein [Candidatus Krumholzibacteriia bacterium]